jgi:hypothetical protein
MASNSPIIFSVVLRWWERAPEAGSKTDRRVYAKLVTEAAMLETREYRCPYCGEWAEALLDLSAGDREYIEDCPVCCRPIVFGLYRDGDEWCLDVRTEND